MRFAFVLEDEPSAMATFRQVFNSLSFSVVEARNRKEADAALAEFIRTGEYPEICVFDFLIDAHPELSGLDIAKKMLSIHKMPAIVCTIYKTVETEHLKILEELMSIGISKKYYISKEPLSENNGAYLKELIIDAISDFKTESVLNLNVFGVVDRYSKSDEGSEPLVEGEKEANKNENKGYDTYNFFDYSAISYLCSGEGNECFLHFANGEKPKRFGSTIGRIGPQIAVRYLPFIKIQQNLYVNLNKVVSIVADTLILYPKKFFKISPEARITLTEKFYIIETNPASLISFTDTEQKEIVHLFSITYSELTQVMYNRYYDLLGRFVKYQCPPSKNTQDKLQDIFGKPWNKLDEQIIVDTKGLIDEISSAVKNAKPAVFKIAVHMVANKRKLDNLLGIPVDKLNYEAFLDAKKNFEDVEKIFMNQQAIKTKSGLVDEILQSMSESDVASFYQIVLAAAKKRNTKKLFGVDAAELDVSKFSKINIAFNQVEKFLIEKFNCVFSDIETQEIEKMIGAPVSHQYSAETEKAIRKTKTLFNKIHKYFQYYQS